MAEVGSYQEILEQKRFLAEIEQGIRYANREIIRKHVPHIDRDRILSFAVAVGRLRARFLEAAFRLGDDDHGEAPNEAEIKELKLRREMFEESRQAFEALTDAIMKGYVVLDGEAQK